MSRKIKVLIGVVFATVVCALVILALDFTSVEEFSVSKANFDRL